MESAVDFLVEERESKIKNLKKDPLHLVEILQKKRYGMAPLGKAVDLQKLVELVSLGFNRELAVEALRRNENDTQKSLDDLTNQETYAAIQVAIELGKSKRRRTEEAATVGQPNEDVAAATGVGTQG